MISCSQQLCLILSVVARAGQAQLRVLMVGPARISMTGTLNAFLEAVHQQPLPLEVEDRKFHIDPAIHQTFHGSAFQIHNNNRKRRFRNSRPRIFLYPRSRRSNIIFLFLFLIDHWNPPFRNTRRLTPISTNISVPK